MSSWFFYLLFATWLMVSSCSSITYAPPAVPSEAPVMTMTNLTPLLSCVGTNLQKTIQQKGSFFTAPNKTGRVPRFLLIINPSDFIDGTVRQNNGISEGKLFDVGYLQLKAIFTRWFPREAVLVTIDEIPFLRQFGIVGSRITQVGGLRDEDYKLLKTIYKVDHIFRLAGAFYKLDGEIPLKDLGYAGTAESRGTDASGGISFGKSNSTNVLGMNVILGTIDTNEAVASTIIEARVNKKSTEVQFKFNWLEDVSRFTGGSISRKLVLAEGVHGAQHLLLEATALWFMGAFFGQEAKLPVCLNAPESDPSKVANQAADLGNLSYSDKVTKIQEVLVQKGLLETGYSVGELDQRTMGAIRKFEVDRQMYETPHIDKTLDDLYLRLLTNM